MDTKLFRTLIKENFKPVLNELGFKGSDHHFIKKTTDHYIYMLVIQANTYGDSCIMEMGVGIDDIQIIEYGTKLTVYDCEFRKRIKPEMNLWDKPTKNSQENWHTYGDNKLQAVRTITEMLELFQKRGEVYYEQFVDFPNPLVDITIHELIEGSKRIYSLGCPPKIRLALLLSKLHQYLGNKSKQSAFAEWGYENVGNAKSLEIEFLKLIQKG